LDFTHSVSSWFQCARTKSHARPRPIVFSEMYTMTDVESCLRISEEINEYCKYLKEELYKNTNNTECSITILFSAKYIFESWYFRIIYTKVLIICYSLQNLTLPSLEEPRAHTWEFSSGAVTPNHAFFLFLNVNTCNM
jgi:hypothetical protein